VLAPVPDIGGEPDSCARPAVRALTRLFAVVDSSERGAAASVAAGAVACEMSGEQYAKVKRFQSSLLRLRSAA
jgi:hypothetical protein